MKKTTLFALLLLFSLSLFCQEWQQRESIFFKEDGKIFFVVDSAISAQRDALADKTKKYLQKDLDFLQEKGFDDSLMIAFVSNRGRLHQLTGKRASGSTVLKNGEMPINSLLLIYDSLHCPLNRELMRVVLATKWGRLQDSRLTWLEQGLSTLVSPEADNCDGYTVEEKYTYLLQRDKLIDLTAFPTDDIAPNFKAARLQAAYIVSHLIEKNGIAKLKQLWIEGMDRFETIFGESFSGITDRINESLQSEYTPPFPMDWKTFTKDCIDPQPDDWLPTHNPFSHPMKEGLLTKDVGEFKFMVSPTISAEDREKAIEDTKMYMSENLALLNETDFAGFLEIILFCSDDEYRYALSDSSFIGTASTEFKNNISYSYVKSVYGNQYNPLKHELMHVVHLSKWGERNYSNGFKMEWLLEGLAVYANPEAYSCDGYTLEERYLYYLQTDQLYTEKDLDVFPRKDVSYSGKRAYNQSGYIVQYIIENYEVEKLKQLWQNGMPDFEKIYGITFAQMIDKINTDLKQKYPDKVDFDEERIKKKCIE